MIETARFAREEGVPYLGICLGMQIAVIEGARNLCGFPDADSGEFAPESSHKVIDLLPDQSGVVNLGGTLRLGAYPCTITPETTMYACYGKDLVQERHRHRYEFNNDYRDILTEQGYTLSRHEK